MIDEIKFSVRNKRISIQQYSPGNYDHEEGYYEIAYIKLSQSKTSYMSDIDLEEIRYILCQLIEGATEFSQNIPKRRDKGASL